MKVENGTDRDVSVPIEGIFVTVPAKGSVDVDARTAMCLGENPALIVDRDSVDEGLAAQHADHPTKIEPVVSPMSEHGPDRSRLTELESAGASLADGDASGFVSGIPGAPDVATVPSSGELKGAELDAALESRGLAKSGTADEKRAAVAAYDAEHAQ